MQELTTFISNHPLLSLSAGIVFFLLSVVEVIRARRLTYNITASQATQMMNHDNAVIIDTRSQDAYRNGHIIGAQSMSQQDIRDNNKKLEKLKGKPLIVVCNAGVESQKIAALLLKRGYNAYSLAGGMRSWIDAQMPIVKE